jgi:hypothetical protein
VGCFVILKTSHHPLTYHNFNFVGSLENNHHTSSTSLQPFLSMFAKLRKMTVSFVMSVHLSVCPSIRLHGKTQLPLDGFSWNLISEGHSKICWENSSSIIIGQEQSVLYVKTCVLSWYLIEFFWEWKMFQTRVVQNIKMHILCSIHFFLKIWDNVKNMVEPDRSQMTIWWRKDETCKSDN